MIVRLLRLWKWIWIAMTNIEIVINLYDEIRYIYEMAIVNCNWDMLYKMKLLWTLKVLNNVHVMMWYWHGYWKVWLLYIYIMNEWITMTIESIDWLICWMIWKLIGHYESADWNMNAEIAMIMEMNMEHAEKYDWHMHWTKWILKWSMIYEWCPQDNMKVQDTWDWYMNKNE